MALDSSDLRLADSYDRQAVKQSASCNARLRNSAFAASACFEVIVREDYAAARDKFEKVNFGALFPAYFAYRARAAYLLRMISRKEYPRK